MGQKISDLKGVLGIMEDRGVNEIRISVESLGLCIDREDDNGNDVRTTMRDREQTSSSSSSSTRDSPHEENGNDASGGSVEPSTSSGACKKRFVLLAFNDRFLA